MIDITKLRPGQMVFIKRARIGKSDDKFGCIQVSKVTKTSITTGDGKRWRADGYEWGCPKTRGLGRAFELRIETAP